MNTEKSSWFGGYWGLALIAFIFLFVITATIGLIYYAGSRKSEEIDLYVSELSKLLPTESNEGETAFIEVRREESVVIFTYQLVPDIDMETESAYANSVVKDELEFVCTLPLVPEFLYWGYEWRIVYLNSNGNLLSKISVTAIDCKEYFSKF